MRNLSGDKFLKIPGKSDSFFPFFFLSEGLTCNVATSQLWIPTEKEKPPLRILHFSKFENVKHFLLAVNKKPASKWLSRTHSAKGPSMLRVILAYKMDWHWFHLSPVSSSRLQASVTAQGKGAAALPWKANGGLLLIPTGRKQSHSIGELELGISHLTQRGVGLSEVG